LLSLHMSLFEWIPPDQVTRLLLSSTLGKAGLSCAKLRPLSLIAAFPHATVRRASISSSSPEGQPVAGVVQRLVAWDTIPAHDNYLMGGEGLVGFRWHRGRPVPQPHSFEVGVNYWTGLADVDVDDSRRLYLTLFLELANSPARLEIVIKSRKKKLAMTE
jgi:hypothetical protein